MADSQSVEKVQEKKNYIIYKTIYIYNKVRI